MRGLIDRVMTLFPFEPSYMEAAGIPADFVGHPVVSEPVATEAEISAVRAKLGLGDASVLLVLPGSRRGEVDRLGPIFGEALRPVLARHPEMRVAVAAAAPVASLVEAGIRRWPGAPVVLDPRGVPEAVASAEKRALFAGATAALAASGTVSLELAAAGTPMVIAYDFNWISRQIIKQMLKIDTVTLVNLVAESRTVPEFLGAACKPVTIAEGLLGVLDAPGAQAEALSLTMDRLGRGDEAPGLRAARSVLSALKAP